MTQEEANKRFNALPKEHRVTIIANECLQEIKTLEMEKLNYVKQHKENLKRINDRIKVRKDWLRKLK